MVLIRSKAEMVDFRFLRYWLNSPMMASHIHGYRDGTVAERLNLPTIRALPVLVPPLHEQRTIARILRALDDKIELNRRMNATLEAMARTLFQNWFVDFGPVRAKLDNRQPTGLDHATAALFPATFQDSPLGPIPHGWGVRTIESLCDMITSGGTPARMNKTYWESGTVPWFKTGELIDGPLLDAEEKITQAGLDNSSCKLWPAGTILFALYASPTVGRLGVLTRPATANQAAAALIPRSTYGISFVVNTLIEARSRLQQIAVGAAQQNINQGVLKSHEVIVPPAPLAKAYSERVKPLWEKRVNLAEETRTLGTLRDTLLPKLLTGESPIGQSDASAGGSGQ
jgi:type I restriction enzyme S subunit